MTPPSLCSWVRAKPLSRDDVPKEENMGQVALGIQPQPSCSAPGEDLPQSREMILKRPAVYQYVVKIHHADVPWQPL